MRPSGLSHHLCTLATAIIFLLTADLSSAQTGKGAREIAAKEAQVKAAEEKLAGSERTLQDLFTKFETQFTELKNGDRRRLRNDLARVLDEPVIKSAEVLGAASDVARAKKTFEAGLAKWIPKLEEEFARECPGTVRTVFLTVFDEVAAKGAAALTPPAIADAAVEKLCDGSTPYHGIWNEDLSKRRPEAKAYADAIKNLEKLRLELAVLKDPKLEWIIGAPTGMARIPDGTYVVEGTYGFPRKRKQIAVKSFYMDLYEVSNEDYWRRYYLTLNDPAVLESRVPRSRDRKPLWKLNPETKRYEPAPETLKKPVVGLDIDAAMAYAAAVGKRLPTEAEWCAAASGAQNADLDYPWGKDYQPGICNDKRAEQGQTVDVTAFPDGRSAFGIYNIAGNVKEWVTTTQDTAKDFATKADIPPGENVVVRGGSFRSNPPRDISTKWRWGLLPINTHEDDVGFRCARDLDVK